MKQFKIIGFIIFLGTLFYSCNKCGNIDCIANYDFGQFRILRGTDGKDLVFGPDKIYDANEIKFYSLNGADTSFFDYQALRFPGADYDSILYVYFMPRTDVAYMQLSNNDVDTLNITRRSFNTKCCGNITEITKFRFNNLVDVLANEGTIEIKK